MVKKKTFPVSKATRLQREMVVESVNGEKKHSQHTVTSENLKSASFHSCICSSMRARYSVRARHRNRRIDRGSER